MTVDVARLQALLDAATDGPWVAMGTVMGVDVGKCTCGGGPSGYYGHEQYCGIEGPLLADSRHEDTELIAAMHDALPALLAVVAERDKLAALVDGQGAK